MGSSRSGRDGISLAELKRAERLIRGGVPHHQVARDLGIDRKTAAKIAAGQHAEQLDPRFERCKACGALSMPPCACKSYINDRTHLPNGNRELHGNCATWPLPTKQASHTSAIRRTFGLGRKRVAAPPLDAPPRPAGKWALGLITGPSGGGKTLLARNYWPGAVIRRRPWPEGTPLVDSFGSAEFSMISAAFFAVRLTDPAVWLQSFQTLSAGQRARAELARVLLLDRQLCVVDDWLAALDRPARLGATRSAAHAVRRGEFRGCKRLVVITTAEELAEIIRPAWHFHVTRTHRVLRRAVD